MPFESGTFALSIFKIPGKLPEDCLEKFAERKAGMLDHVTDEPSIGWVSGRHLLETEIDESTAICGGHIYLNMRTAERKIPAVLLNAICRRAELAYMQENDSITVPSKEKRRIKADAIEKNLRKIPPSISGIPFVLDKAANMMYLGTGSTSQVDNFLAFFFKTLEIEPIQVTIDEMMEGRSYDLPSVAFTTETPDEDPVPARDFLTWLWYYSETEGGSLTHEKYGDFEIMIEGPLTLAFSSEETKGSCETSIKKGNPLRSAEAKAALQVGKKLKKAKFIMARGQDIWRGSFDADKFAFSGIALPDGEEMERDSSFLERINFLYVFYEVFQAYFKKYAETAMASNWMETEKKMQQWVKERDSY
jgi:hypothetical protein